MKEPSLVGGIAIYSTSHHGSMPFLLKKIMPAKDTFQLDFDSYFL